MLLVRHVQLSGYGLQNFCDRGVSPVDGIASGRIVDIAVCFLHKIKIKKQIIEGMSQAVRINILSRPNFPATNLNTTVPGTLIGTTLFLDGFTSTISPGLA